MPRTRRRQPQHRWHSDPRGFAPWAGAARFFGPGEVRLALLSLLSERGRHGYDLMKRLEERSAGTYRASPGTVYPALQQLEDQGLAVSQNRSAETLESNARTL